MSEIPADSALAPASDFMVEPLPGGWCYQNANESEILHGTTPDLEDCFDASYLWSPSPGNNDDSGKIPGGGDAQNKEQPMVITTIGPRGQGYIPVIPPPLVTFHEDCTGGLSEYIANEGHISRLMERLNWAVECIGSSAVDRDTLIQVWVPVSKGGVRFLTTNGQPFSLHPRSLRLAGYRNISVKYQFAAENVCGRSLGLLRGVFLHKVPEWTPDVRLFKKDEFLRSDYAQEYHVCGTLALPIFEKDSRICVGVVEVVMTAQKISCRPELEMVCKALEAVDLRSSGAISTQETEGFSFSYQVAPEILEFLRTACANHDLPLAQTWVPCIQQGKGGLWHLEENYFKCVSTVDSACYVANPRVQGFHEACSEHHLFKGQGLAGGAFMTNKPCFSPDLTSLRKTEYPLSHHARIFGLHAAVAIRLRSIYTGFDFVVEFFLPLDCRHYIEQKNILSSLSAMVHSALWSLRVVTDKKLEEETGAAIKKVLPLDGRVGCDKVLTVEEANLDMSSPEESSLNASPMEVQHMQDRAEIPKTSKRRALPHAPTSKQGLPCDEKDPNLGDGSFSHLEKTGERKRSKGEITITLQKLKQYFAYSLSDAAKCLGVCPTTLKRICRQQGINRWPSRKIKKVGHSLQNLQLQIDSVCGTSGTFEIGPMYSMMPGLDSSKPLETGPITRSDLKDTLKPLAAQPGDGFSGPKSNPRPPSSSCSLSNTSNTSCPHVENPPSPSGIAVSTATVAGEDSNAGMLNRVRSDTKLLPTFQGGLDDLSRSKGHRVRSANPNTEMPPPPETHASDPVAVEESWRVKVAHGEELVRLRMQRNWHLIDLMQEIRKRFRINDTSGYHLRYLDDDSEWVTLTCDADLEECVDICRSMHSDTIKLSLVDSSHHPSS